MNLYDMLSLKEKVVIITGGAQGIGKDVAKQIAAVGADIVIFDIQENKGKETAQEIAKEYNCRAVSYCIDSTNPDEVVKGIEEADKKMGKLDLLFNNAGICLHKEAIDVKSEEWLNVINVNLNGIFFVAQAFARYLIKKNKPGSIVNTASMSGTIVNYPQPQASYNASKAGVIHLTKSLAMEWADKGIRVNSISPGYIQTDLCNFVRDDWQEFWTNATPQRRMGKTEELAGAVIYLLSDASSYATGSDFIIDGGYTIL